MRGEEKPQRWALALGRGAAAERGCACREGGHNPTVLGGFSLSLILLSLLLFSHQVGLQSQTVHGGLLPGLAWRKAVGFSDKF